MADQLVELNKPQTTIKVEPLEDGVQMATVKSAKHPGMEFRGFGPTSVQATNEAKARLSENSDQD